MNKVYVIAPLIGLALFSGVYAKHAREFDERAAETRRVERLAAEEKTKQQRAAQAAAIEAAQAAIELRKRERAEQERVEERRKQARLDAEQRRLAAANNEQRLRTRLERLRAELASTGDLVARTERQNDALQREQAFIVDHIQQASANREKLFSLLEKLEAAERARHDVGSAPRPKTPRE
jgi:hypothetical protein